MTLIDQRILIDAPPHVIWDYITDPAKIAHWHAGYSGISVLTTQRSGTGTRRRCTRIGGGGDIIEEITAWVEGLGYEYRALEGEPRRKYQGRIRLQSVPDGTIVQWTVSYEPKGPVGALRDRMSGRQEIAAVVATSLRQLRRMVDELGLRMDDDYRSRVGIRPRLNAAERAQYQRRHPPTDTAGLETAVAVNSPALVPAGAAHADIAPELAEEATDARFRPPVAAQPAAPRPLITEPEPGPDQTPTTPRPSVARPEADVPPPDYIAPPAPDELSEAPALPYHIAPPAAVAPGEALSQPVPAASGAPVLPPAPAPDATPADAVEPDWKRRTPPRGLPAVRADSQPWPSPVPDERPAAEPHIPPNAPAAPPVPVVAGAPESEERANLPPQTPKTDTGDLSIWEVFGMQRPSEQDADALQDLLRSVYGTHPSPGPCGIIQQRRAAVRHHNGGGLRAQSVVAAARLRTATPRAAGPAHRQQKTAPKRR